MASIKLSSGYKVVSEGEHTFTVIDVKYEEDFAKLQLKMETESGEKHTEYFSFKNNDKALFAFTMTAKILMNNDNITDIDPVELVGKTMIADVRHTVSQTNGKTYAILENKRAAESEENNSIVNDDIDLDDLFG